jgi:hypothetical protein
MACNVLLVEFLGHLFELSQFLGNHFNGAVSINVASLRGTKVVHVCNLVWD